MYFGYFQSWHLSKEICSKLRHNLEMALGRKRHSSGFCLPKAKKMAGISYQREPPVTQHAASSADSVGAGIAGCLNLKPPA